VTETAHCEYELIFETALVCHNDSMLVYPVLNSDQQTSWNRLLTELNNEELTEKVRPITELIDVDRVM